MDVKFENSAASVKVYNLEKHRKGDTLPPPIMQKIDFSIMIRKLIPHTLINMNGYSIRIENQKAY